MSSPSIPWSPLNDGTSNITNWEEHVHPELKPTLADYGPPTSYDSWLKTRIMSALMHIPSSISHDVGMKKIKGVGQYFYPTSDENDGQAPNTSCAAILWMHGGGFIMGSANGCFNELCSRIVQIFGVPVLSAEYATRNCFPAPLNDCHKAYTWLAQHLMDDPEANGKIPKIAVMGDSAGGGLAAQLCQRLLDESKEEQQDGATSSLKRLPLPVCQLLTYPMLDDRTCINESLCKMPPHLVWNNKSNIYGWQSYLGRKYKPGDKNIPKYAAASRREDLSGLPPCYIVVGDLDLFHDECTVYARRLKDAGVETEFDEIKGGFHAMMSSGKIEQPKPVADAWERCQAFGKKFLFD